MLAINDKGRLLQIIKHCDRILFKINNIDYKGFECDMDIKEIVCFNIFQIGEIAKGLSEDFIKEYNKVPWKQIKGMRDRIGHGYDTIDIEIVWQTSIESIPELKKYCKYIIDNY